MDNKIILSKIALFQQDGNWHELTCWTSFDRNLKEFTKRSDRGNRFHPTQKPIKLYEWIFANYAEEGNLILDTHLGSQSSRIAANKAGLDFVGFEIDREYFDNGNKRFKNFVSQGVLF